MNTIQISHYVNNYQRKNTFKGVFPCDNLPKKVILPALLIVNLSRKSEPGSHWISIFIDKQGKGYYFDSFGIPPRNKYVKLFMKMHSKSVYYNRNQLQHITSSKCGKYCCVFAVSILKFRTINQFLIKFSKNLFVNEIMIEKMYGNLKK